MTVLGTRHKRAKKGNREVLAHCQTCHLTSRRLVVAMAPQAWRVVGGSSNGGIVVRVDKDTKSQEASQRLKTGSLIQEIEVQGERLRFALLSGEGPECGWVSLHFKGNELVQRVAEDVGPVGPGDGRSVWVMSSGSRGDMQPLIALSTGLRKAGYSIRMFVPDLYRDTVEALGCDYSDGGSWGEVIEQLGDILKSDLRAQGIDIQELKVRTYEKCYAAMATSLRQELDKRKPDLMIWGGDAAIFALGIWRQYAIPTIHATATLPDAKHWPEAERLAPVVAKHLGFNPLEGFTEASWKDAQMDWDTLLIGCSATIFDAGILDSRILRLPENAYGGPAHYREMMRKHRTKFTGSWICDQHTEHDTKGDFWGGSATQVKLQKFLSEGDAPVYIGWGSMMPPAGPKVVLLSTLGALMLAGKRGIVLEGWAQLTLNSLKEICEQSKVENHKKIFEYAKENVLFVETAPHQWLFPQCSALIHHGGAGTFVAGLRAGVPQIITPMYYDQFMYADMVSKMGIGFAVENWSTPKLQKAVEGCTDAAGPQKAKAKEMAVGILKENGVSAGVEIVNTFWAEQVETGNFQRKWQEAHPNAVAAA